MSEDEVLGAYDFELDPPTMLEFHLGMCLGTFMNMYDNWDAYTEEDFVRLFESAAGWIEDFKKKYSEMMNVYGRPIMPKDDRVDPTTNEE